MSWHNRHRLENNFKWDDGRRDALIAMLKAGKSSSEIAGHFGCSRNVIMGKLYREKDLPRLARNHGAAESKPQAKLAALPSTVSLPGGKKAPVRQKAESRQGDDMAIMARVRARKEMKSGKAAPPMVGFDAQRFQPGFMGQKAGVKSIADLKNHHCRFPLDLDDGGVGYCGAVRVDHSSYCADHHARCCNQDPKARPKFRPVGKFFNSNVR